MDREMRIISIVILLIIAGACLMKPEIFTNFFNPAIYKTYYNLSVNRYATWLTRWSLVLILLVYYTYILFDRIIIKRRKIKNNKTSITIFLLFFCAWISITFFKLYQLCERILKKIEQEGMPDTSSTVIPFIMLLILGYFSITRINITSDINRQTFAVKVNLFFESLAVIFVILLISLVDKYSSANVKFNLQKIQIQVMALGGLGLLVVIFGALSFLCRNKKTMYKKRSWTK